MKNILSKTLLAISLGLLSATSMAAAPTTVNIKLDTKADNTKDANLKVVEDAVQKYLAQPNPSFKLNKISKVEEVPGLYEIIHNRNNIVYITSDGETLISGNVITLKDMANVTDDKKAKLSVIDFKTLPKNPITYKYGTGVNKLAIFSDPKCPFCKAFEPEVAKLKDVTISLYLIPILGEESMTISESILCSKNPGAAWSKWMLEGKMPEEKKCTAAAKSINVNLNFAKEYGINGTPAIIFENGELVKGKFPADKIQDYFKVLSEKKETPSKDSTKK